MDELENLLFGHVKEQMYEKLLQKERDRSIPIQTSDRSPGSYVLVDIPSKKERRQSNYKRRTQRKNSDTNRNL